nr:copia protein [Tanacetum cinerariifolium]
MVIKSLLISRNPNTTGHSNRDFVPLVMYADDDQDWLLSSRMAGDCWKITWNDVLVIPFDGRKKGCQMRLNSALIYRFLMVYSGLGIETVVYADSDHAGDYVDRKSTSGICTFMGCCLTSWFSKKKTALAISTTETEYVSAEKECQQVLWMKQALVDYCIRLNDIPIMCDNKGEIDLRKNPVQHLRTKHIEIPHHFLRDNVQKGNISIEKVHLKDNIADILNKPLKRDSFNYLRLGPGMIEQND